MELYSRAASRPPASARAVSPLWSRAFGLWAVVALLALVPVSRALDAALPILTVIWIGVPLWFVLQTKDTSRVGFSAVPWPLLLRTTVVNLGLFFVVMLAFEPWSHTYEKLLAFVMSADPLDSTFAWLVRFPRLPALAGMTAFSGLVTMFGEELFFRGLLLQALRRKMPTPWAILTQATLFAVPNLVVTMVMAPPQAVVYVLAYAWLAIGVIGGWAAARTGSIWPSLVTATFGNLVMVALLDRP